jgi:hypothetical protein
MEITPQILILVGIVCVVLGFIANLLLNTLREDEVGPGGTGGSASERSDPDAAPPGGKKGRYDRISRLWRERGTGRLIVEIEGKSYVNPNPLNEMQREQLEAAARDLQTWLGVTPKIPVGAPAPAAEEASTPGRVPSTIPAPSPTVTPAVSTPAPIQETPAVSPASQEKPLSNTVQAKPPVPPATEMPAVEIPNVPPARSTSTKKTAQAAGVPPAGAPPVGGDKSAALPNLSIVAQIEEILQEMIAGTSLAARDIHLEEDPSRGVIVRVGSERFEGIDSVTDSEVKAAIREAVVAWENGAWRFSTKK